MSALLGLRSERLVLNLVLDQDLPELERLARRERARCSQHALKRSEAERKARMGREAMERRA